MKDEKRMQRLYLIVDYLFNPNLFIPRHAWILYWSVFQILVALLGIYAIYGVSIQKMQWLIWNFPYILLGCAVLSTIPVVVWYVWDKLWFRKRTRLLNHKLISEGLEPVEE